MSRDFSVVIERDEEGYYVASVPALTGAKALQALERGGLTVLRVHSSHLFLRHVDGRKTVIPVQAGDMIGPGLMSKFLRAAA